ncbi:MAG: hypothetical protein ACWA41_06635 [Putridiphycobacter sp.]
MSQSEKIVKQEKIGYLKSKLNLMQGVLTLTPNRLILEAHKTGVGGRGLLDTFLRKQVEKKNYGFALERSQIKAVNQGKHGVQKNVLEITNPENETFRIIVQDYQEWEDLLK